MRIPDAFYRMIAISCTRFTGQTWEENCRYRRERGITGALYGTPRRIRPSYAANGWLFVLEMDNTNNKVLGIGLITNTVIMDKRYSIHTDGNYNRFAYRGKHRLDRTDLSARDQRMLGVFDTLLFKGKRHCKFAQGITEVGSWIRNGPFDFIGYFKGLFTKHHPSIQWT